MINLTVHSLIRDEGTIVIFAGDDSQGRTRRFACDHRPAQDIATALEEGEDVTVTIENWQLVGR